MPVQPMHKKQLDIIESVIFINLYNKHHFSFNGKNNHRHCNHQQRRLSIMTLQPINIDEDKTKEIYANADCQDVLKTYDDFYKKIGFNLPWVGYFIIRDNKVTGVCGFTGQPKNGKVEIAYHTFKQLEGQGIATTSCKQLVLIAKKTDPEIIITAKTLPETNASTKILERNGFEFSGMVKDEEIGDAWEWTYKKIKN